ncbi:MAG: sulfotransferase family protein [Rubrobacteraceae bacterium]
MNILFITGPGRSGTTALTDYLNVHPEILVCRERYKFVIPQINPNFFLPEKVLGDRTGETSMPAWVDTGLFEEKDLMGLKWIGDKNPGYVRSMALLLKNNPGARFIVTYRPIEEVAESYEEVSRDPRGAWLTGQDGFKVGVENWNVTMRKTRRFVEGCLEYGLDPNLLIVGYHDFFGDGQKDCARLVSRFLGLKFDSGIVNAWEAMSSSFENGKRKKNALGDEQRTFLDENKDSVAEAWVLARMSRQWEELRDEDKALEGERGVAREVGESGMLKIQAEEEAQAEEIKRLRRRMQGLRARMSKLERQMEGIHGSASWRLLRKLGGVKSRLWKKMGRKP